MDVVLEGVDPTDSSPQTDVRARPRRPWTPARDALVVLGEYAAEALYGLAHPQWRDSGSTVDEVTRPLVGDDLVPEANWQATRAITIDAASDRVWPWLAQAGYGRGGWYGDLPWWKDPEGATGPRSSASELLPEHQHIAVGDVLLDGPNCDETTGAWRVAQADPGRSLVLFSRRTISGREIGADEPHPSFYFECSWAFDLVPVDAGTSRLVIRSRARVHPAWLVSAAAVLRAGDTVMQRAMLIGIQRRAEHRPAGVLPTPAARVDRVPVPDLCTLWAETSTTPMHLALAGIIDPDPLLTSDGSVDIDLVREVVQQHLDRAPMLRRVLVRPPMGFGGPIWVDDDSFRIDDHVTLVTPSTPMVDEEAFWSWSATRCLLPLDRSRPLWRLDIVSELPGGRVGLLLVAHHVVVDGLRGAAVLMRLLDTDPAAGRGPTPVWRPEPRPSLPELALDRVRALSRLPKTQAVGTSLRGVRSMRREQSVRAPDTILGGPIGPGRHLKVVHAPLESLRALAHASGCTINDLLLAAVASGLHRFLSDQEECPPDLVLRATVPVGAGERKPSGMLVVPLPVGVPDPAERLRLIAAETARRKQRADEGVAGIVAMPRLLARIGVTWARRAASSHISLYVTNVPGPPARLYLGGAALRTVAPMAPLVAGVRLSVTALSYAGSFVVTFLGDDHLGDLQALADAAAEVLVADAPALTRP